MNNNGDRKTLLENKLAELESAREILNDMHSEAQDNDDISE
jgi:hypothetical protein